MKMLAMQGSGSGDSYAENSSGQRHNFHSVAKPCLEQAIQHLLCNSTLQSKEDDNNHVLPRHHVAVADLGCSHGCNTLEWAEFVISTLMRGDSKVAHKDEIAPPHLQEIQYFFSDLPSNDFNALFQSLQLYFHETDAMAMAIPTKRLLPKVFTAGVPGSFYNCLFPSRSLHLVICSYALHFLSQAPPSLVDKSSPSWNGGHTWISNAGVSRKGVLDAYACQSRMDVRKFLQSRAHELISGGILFLFSVARSPEKECISPHHKGGSISFQSLLEVFDYAWRELVAEGRITSEEMDMFNIPLYYFNQQELEEALKDVPEFAVQHMKTMENMALFSEQRDRMETVELWVHMMSSIFRPIVEAHVGTHKAYELFKRLRIIGLTIDGFDSLITHNLVIASLQRL